MRITFWAAAATLVLAGCSAPIVPRRTPGTAVSRDGRIAILSSVSRAGQPMIAVRHDRASLIAPSPVGLDLARTRFGPMRITGRSYVPAGRDGCSHGTMALRERGGARRSLRLETRACNSGVAFRIVVPAQPGLTKIRLAGETTKFVISRDDACLGVKHKQYFNSHEGDYKPVTIKAISPGELYDLPLTCVTGRAGETYALTESAIENYSAAYLTGTPKRDGIAVRLTPRPTNTALAVVSDMPANGFRTPWRVVMIADRPERMIANRLVETFAEPSRIGDARWVVPGKAAWGWWSGLLAPEVPNAGHNMATYEYYIDFAARLHLPYYVIDQGWALERPGKDTPEDVLQSAQNVDIPALVEYARVRHVRLWLWTDWRSLDGKLEAVLAQWQRWGVAGMKVDFIYRQDQDVVAFYHTLLADAARHRMLVDIHAAFVPRGLDKTYPNFLTQEGAMGNEYNRWSRDVTAGYNVRAAYSRATIGPMDYTPGGFRNVTPAAFSWKVPAPEVMTTRAQQLALFVVYPSPLTMLADAPVAYRNGRGGWAPGVDFLREVPTTWDATVGAGGTFGEWIAVARRHGRRWYVGIITDETARTVSIPLGFLGAGKWTLRAWLDGKTPTALDRRNGTIDRVHNLIVPIAASGGATLIFEQ